MNLWQRLMRCLGAYEVRTCPWCWGEVLVRDGLPIHMGDVCRGWSRSHVRPLADETTERK